MTAANQAEADEPGGTVRFLLDGELHAVSGLDPNTTVLTYLREHLRRTGTKEGCAEGDCGACTVVVGELDGDRLRFRALNSCIQLLPTLDGKLLVTVESLVSPDGELHPVQRAMVDCHGSQCGFCTPGFVMSLFALYKSERDPDRRRIRDVLAGNLCRCTGYRPILDAARAMYERGRSANGHWLHAPADPGGQPGAAERELVERLRGLGRRRCLELAAPAAGGGEHRYWAPTRLAELTELAERHPDARLVAGCTDVGLWITKELRQIEQTIYVGNVEELRRLEVTDGHLEIGAAVTRTDTYRELAERFPDFGELLRRFASPPIRNAATLGGNVVTGSPIGDSLPALLALDASVVLVRGERRRELPLDELYLGYRRTALEPGELLERVRVPLTPPDRLFRAYKISKRFDQDISAVCAAFCLRLEDGRARDVRIGFGGMSATPERARRCEQAIEGARWSEEAVAAGLEALDADFTPISDMRASRGYRRQVARNLLRKFFYETAGPDGSALDGATRILEYGAQP